MSRKDRKTRRPKESRQTRKVAKAGHCKRQRVEKWKDFLVTACMYHVAPIYFLALPPILFVRVRNLPLDSEEQFPL